jgi:hypothetical protein
MVDVVEGFWLPGGLRAEILAGAAWETRWLLGGQLNEQAVPGAVAVRWPRLAPDKWRDLLDGLQRGRAVPAGEAIARWQAALASLGPRLAADAEAMLPLLAACTGYSPQMLNAALGQGDLLAVGPLAAALAFRPHWSVAEDWEAMPGLPGRVRFFPAARWDRSLARLRRDDALCRPVAPADAVLGFAAGNVPGTAFLIGLLGSVANCASDHDALTPAVLLRNSRHEPLFAPWVLSALEDADPGLVAACALMIWDYEDAALQGELLRRADLLIAAAGDEAIRALEAQRAAVASACRFHQHGHKVSFSAISEPTPRDARLAALDSCLWDQNGCLSSRVHFVAGVPSRAEEYAAALAGEMRALAEELPRGTTPRRFVHRAFDSYAALAARGNDVKVFSAYRDDFAVVLDSRPWDAAALVRTANACVGRVVVVRPVADLMDVPRLLGSFPPVTLQSVSVAMPQAQVQPFAEVAGGCGVTALRSLGRAAFPQLAYSWDGLLPVDLGSQRPAGHFTTIEFADLAQEMDVTASRWMSQNM